MEAPTPPGRGLEHFQSRGTKEINRCPYPKSSRSRPKALPGTWSGLRHGRAFHYDPDSTLTRHGTAIKVYADNGAVGEYAGSGASPQAIEALAERYLGQSAMDRERYYQGLKASPAMAAYDIALWDLAGKMTGLPVHALIGTYRTRVPAYASTIDGAVSGPLSTPESYGDFAEQCREMGYRGFKIHPFAWPDVQSHCDAVLAIAESVGGEMDMMLDSYCLYETFSRRAQGGAGLRRGRVLLVRGPLLGRRGDDL